MIFLKPAHPDNPKLRRMRVPNDIRQTQSRWCGRWSGPKNCRSWPTAEDPVALHCCPKSGRQFKDTGFDGAQIFK